MLALQYTNYISNACTKLHLGSLAELGLSEELNIQLYEIISLFFLVTEIHGRLHEDLQPDLHDVPDLPLVGVPPVPGAHAPGLPPRLLGQHQRARGDQSVPNYL